MAQLPGSESVLARQGVVLGGHDRRLFLACKYLAIGISRCQRIAEKVAGGVRLLLDEADAGTGA